MMIINNAMKIAAMRIPMIAPTDRPGEEVVGTMSGSTTTLRLMASYWSSLLWIQTKVFVSSQRFLNFSTYLDCLFHSLSWDYPTYSRLNVHVELHITIAIVANISNDDVIWTDLWCLSLPAYCEVKITTSFQNCTVLHTFQRHQLVHRLEDHLYSMSLVPWL